jgi:transposase
MPRDDAARADQLIVVGVDTHKEFHVAVALDTLGRRLGELTVPTNAEGYASLERWALELGQPQAWGVEGTGSYGAGLARQLRQHDWHVIEVDRPNRQVRRKRGKDDAIDAEQAARAVLAGTATTLPKAADGAAEMIRLLKLTRDSAIKSRTQTICQIESVLITAPSELREELRRLPRKELIAKCGRFRVPASPANVIEATRYALRTLSRRYLALRAEADELTIQIKELVATYAPNLMKHVGVGPDNAAALLLAVGDNPKRMRSEAAFAALCGVSPVPASSGNTQRHRLNRGGDRQANCALHRIVIVRMQWHDPTKRYVERRLAEGKQRKEIIRCLKRFTARQLYPVLTNANAA